MGGSALRFLLFIGDVSGGSALPFIFPGLIVSAALVCTVVLLCPSAWRELSPKPCNLPLMSMGNIITLLQL